MDAPIIRAVFFVRRAMSKRRIHPNRLKETKKLLDIPLAKIVREIGWTYQRAQDCYHNRTQLPVWVAVEIQNKFGVNAAYVLGIQENPSCKETSIVRYVDVERRYDSEEMSQAIEAINQAKAQASLAEHRMNKALRLIRQAGE